MEIRSFLTFFCSSVFHGSVWLIWLGVLVFHFCSRDLNIILIDFRTSNSFACHWVEILFGVLLRILWESPGEITLIAVGSNWSATPFHIYLSSLPRHTKVTKYRIVNHYYFIVILQHHELVQST